jgi:hypothetical protein
MEAWTSSAAACAHGAIASSPRTSACRPEAAGARPAYVGRRSPQLTGLSVDYLTLDCNVLRVAGTDLELVVFTAEPGTLEASTLAMIGSLGLQSFAR